MKPLAKKTCKAKPHYKHPSCSSPGAIKRKNGRGNTHYEYPYTLHHSHNAFIAKVGTILIFYFAFASGYMSPEYVMHGRFSVKSDVFSLGVLLLEIISGKRNTGVFQPGHTDLLCHVSTPILFIPRCHFSTVITYS